MLSKPIALLAIVLLSVPARASDPWQDLKKGGKPAQEALAELKKGGAKAFRRFLVDGLGHKDFKVRAFCADIIPPQLLYGSELPRLFSALLELKGLEKPAEPFPEDLLDSLYELGSEAFKNNEVLALPEVGGWCDQARLLQVIGGATKGRRNTWAKGGKKGRQARYELARELVPVLDSSAIDRVTKAILDKTWDAEERGPVFWIVRLGLLGGYPGDQAIKARLKSLLLSKNPRHLTKLMLTRPIQAARSLPLLVAYPQSLPLVRDALLEAGKDVDLVALWAAALIQTLGSKKEVRKEFWSAGVPALSRFLKGFDDPVLTVSYFFLLAPVLGGEASPGRLSPQSVKGLASIIGPALQKVAREGGITSDYLSGLLTTGNLDILTQALEATPKEDLDLLLEEPEDALATLDMATAKRLAAATSPVVARVGKLAVKVLGERPANQPDKILKRLVNLPDPEQQEIIKEALKRKLLADLKSYHPWWHSFVGEDNAGAAPLARKHPAAFRSWLQAAAKDKEEFFTAVSWCVRHRVDTPWRDKLPDTVLKALLATAAGEPDTELPGLLSTLGPWLAETDRRALADRWLGLWSQDPESLDSGDAQSDWALLLGLHAGREQELLEAIEKLLDGGVKDRVLETCLGGRPRLLQLQNAEGKPRVASSRNTAWETKVIKAALNGEIQVSTFMALHLWPITAQLPRLAKILEPLGDEGWDHFLPLAWLAHNSSGPTPTLPPVPDPSSATWQMAAKGDFVGIYAGLLKASTAEESQFTPAGALRGLALAARSKEERTRAIILITPYLHEPVLGYYWDAVLAAAHLGDRDANEELEKALEQGRTFFLRRHLLPWVTLDRSRRWVGFLTRSALPGSGLIGSGFQEAMGALIPELSVERLGQSRWAGKAWKRLKDSPKLRWSRLYQGWEIQR